MAWDKTREHRTLTGRPWRRLREQILARDLYLCQCSECAKRLVPLEANEVDHIIPLSKGGTDKPDNLRGINRGCHKVKTERERMDQQGAKPKPKVRIDESGWPCSGGL